MIELTQAVTIPSHIFTELYSTIADEITLHICKTQGIDMYAHSTGNDLSYSEEAQEIFNEQSDYAEQMIELCGIFKGDK